MAIRCESMRLNILYTFDTIETLWRDQGNEFGAIYYREIAQLEEVGSPKMKNPVIFYAAIVIGLVALAVGIYYQINGGHPARAVAGIAVGVILVIVGIVGMFMARSRAVAK